MKQLLALLMLVLLTMPSTFAQSNRSDLSSNNLVESVQQVQSWSQSNEKATSEVVALLQNDKFIVRIERLDDNHHKLSIWSKPKTVTDEPGVTLDQENARIITGNGEEYRFDDRNVTYSVSVSYGEGEEGGEEEDGEASDETYQPVWTFTMFQTLEEPEVYIMTPIE